MASFSGYAENDFHKTRNKYLKQVFMLFIPSPGIKGTPYVKMENCNLTPDTDTPDTIKLNEITSSAEKTTPEDMWTTPKRSHRDGVDFTKCRRINFDTPEDEEEAEKSDI